MKLTESALKPLATITVALVLGTLLILPTGTSPVEAYRALLFGAFGNLQNLAATLARATPLLFTGLAAAFAFQSGIFNIGAEGQMYLGAFTAALVGIYAGGLPALVVQPLALLAAALAGGIWSLPAGLFRARLQINEVISTIMLNNIAILFTGYLATYPFKGELPIGATSQVSPAARLLQFTDRSNLNMGFVVAVGLTIALYYFLYNTGYGFEFRALGTNPTFAGYIGVGVPTQIVKGLFLSGMIAGLGGAEQVLGVHLRFISGFSPGYAFTGITVALLGRLHPFGVLVGAIFFGALENGALRMETMTTVSRDLLTALQGIIILLLAAEYLLKFKSRVRGRLNDPA
ncbi:MAG: ABC transporter permease [Firmicutes bacterium]|nr:ABC transporter permease [Bacillota bacterium]